MICLHLFLFIASVSPMSNAAKSSSTHCPHHFFGLPGGRQFGTSTPTSLLYALSSPPSPLHVPQPPQSPYAHHSTGLLHSTSWHLITGYSISPCDLLYNSALFSHCQPTHPSISLLSPMSVLFCNTDLIHNSNTFPLFQWTALIYLNAATSL